MRWTTTGEGDMSGQVLLRDLVAIPRASAKSVLEWLSGVAASFCAGRDAVQEGASPPPRQPSPRASPQSECLATSRKLSGFSTWTAIPKQQFSLAYVRLAVTAVGFTINVQETDYDGVDLEIRHRVIRDGLGARVSTCR
jgi:hypothetical protein